SGTLSEAVSALDRAAAIYGQRGQSTQAAAALLQLVQVQLSQGEMEGAEASAGQLASRFPESVPAHYSAGLVALRGGDADGAIAALRQAVAMAPGQPELDALLGAAYLAAGNLGQAEQQLSSALDPARPAIGVVRMLAETRLRQGRP